MKKTFFQIITLLWSTFFYTTQVFGCSCMPSESPEISLEKATWVFIGTVGNIEKVGVLGELIWNTSYKNVYFNVWEKIKWNYQYTTNIKTANDGAACWYEFEIWKQYIVYTYWENDEQEVSLCSRTKELIYAQEDINAFWEIIWWNNFSENNDTSWVIQASQKKPINIPIIIILAIISILFVYLRKIRK